MSCQLKKSNIMFEMLAGIATGDGSAPVEWQVEVETTNRRSFRLIYVNASAAATSGMIGCHEFQLFDAQGRNLCRTAGFIPKIGYTKKLTQGPWFDPVRWGPDKTIDGNISSWESTCYGNPSALRDSFIQYTFLADFMPTRWSFKCEGNYIPGSPGVALERLNSLGQWVDVTGTGVPTTWSNNSTKNFTMPTFID